MLDPNISTDQAEGLRLLMQTPKAKDFSVMIAIPNIDHVKIINFLRDELSLQDYDQINEYASSNVSEVKKTEASGTSKGLIKKNIICLNHSTESIKQAYRMIKKISTEKLAVPIEIYVFAKSESQAKIIFSNLAHASIFYLSIKLKYLGCTTKRKNTSHPPMERVNFTQQSVMA